MLDWGQAVVNRGNNLFLLKVYSGFEGLFLYLIENNVIGNLWFNASSLTLQQQVIDQTVLQTKGTRSQNGKANHFKVLVQQVRVKESGCKERSFFIKDNANGREKKVRRFWVFRGLIFDSDYSKILLIGSAVFSFILEKMVQSDFQSSGNFFQHSIMRIYCQFNWLSNQNCQLTIIRPFFVSRQ